MIEVLAPGKLFLVGEYAVLDGAPAVVAAVDCGVSCRVQISAALEIEAPDGDDRFVRPAIESIETAPPGRYVFTSWNPVQTLAKPGMGGSASATVAALTAARALAGEAPDPDLVTHQAQRIHRDVQGGGSGIDVAACVWGGLRVYDHGSTTPLPPRQPVVVYSGDSAATGPRVQRYLQWTERQAFIDRSSALATQFCDHPVEALRVARELLDAMTQETGIPYWTDGLRRICTLAEDCGGAAKPSGAGGGDCAVGLFEDPLDRVRFVTACEQEGFSVIPVHLAPGVSSRTLETPHE